MYRHTGHKHKQTWILQLTLSDKFKFFLAFLSALNRKGLQQHLKQQIIDMDKNYYTIFFYWHNSCWIFTRHLFSQLIYSRIILVTSWLAQHEIQIFFTGVNSLDFLHQFQNFYTRIFINKKNWIWIRKERIRIHITVILIFPRNLSAVQYEITERIQIFS